MHAGSDCGPRVIEYPESCTQLNCDRDAYLFGDGSSQFLSSLRHGWLIQDVHDPNDVTWGHNEFAQVQLHGPATIYCLLPTQGAAGGVSEATCQNAYCEGHSHTLQDVQQALPMWAAQNWQPTGQTITESNGVVCEIYKIQASQPTTLYHTTHLGWSLVYIVDYEPPAGQYTQATGSMTGASIFGQQSRPVSGQPTVQELHGDGFESCGKPVLKSTHDQAAFSLAPIELLLSTFAFERSHKRPQLPRRPDTPHVRPHLAAKPDRVVARPLRSRLHLRARLREVLPRAAEPVLDPGQSRRARHTFLVCASDWH